jgi:tetratricopeptide (TPR) repeat protein
MASVFLSYVREDAGKARALAAILERGGHSVWWDRQIKGGAQYSAEIEAALDAADKVIVLWSARSIGSAWVRDEAAAGRDTGRLVPLTLDRTVAPLGFRQFQTIDLSKWNGRGSGPGIKDLQEALGTPRRPEKPLKGALFDRPKLRLSRASLLAGVAILFVAAAATAAWLWSSARAAEEPRVAIMAADASPLSRQVAHDLMVALPNLSSGSAAPFELLDESSASSPKTDLILKVGAASPNGRERREFSVIASDQTMLWSTSVEQPLGKSADLLQQLTIQAQRALSCAAEALSYRRETIRQDTLKLYVSGCTNADSAYGTNNDNGVQDHLFEQVIAKAPHFIPAWARLFDSEADEFGSAVDYRALQRKMAAQIARAENLGLDFGELYVAKAAVLSPADFVGIFRLYDEGVKRHPDNAALFRSLSSKYVFVGRMNDSVNAGAHAVQLDPLSPATQTGLAWAYANAGNAEAAFAELRKAERLWPGSASIIFTRYALDLRYGDPKEALSLLQEPSLQGPLQAEQAAFLHAKMDPTTQNIDRAIATDEEIYHEYPEFTGQIVQTLAQFRRKDQIIDILTHYKGGEQSGFAAEVLFRPALRDVWRDPRSMAAAAHLGLLHYWKVSGNWPDFCSDPTLPYDCRKEADKYPI